MTKAPFGAMTTTTTDPGLRWTQALPYANRSTHPPGVAEVGRHTAAGWLPHNRLAARWVIARRVAALAGLHATSLPTLGFVRGRLREGITQANVAYAFALIRAVAAEQLGLKPCDVQLMAAWSMLRGDMVELAAGEGKTLAAAVAATTAALAGRLVHVVTVNDYLAERDHAQLTPVYHALGLTCGLIVRGMSAAERRAAYACDVVYTSNKELVFDYLRDQVCRRAAPSTSYGHVTRLDGHGMPQGGLVLRDLDLAIVDEADSVLIDEARTPLIMSEHIAAAGSAQIYTEAFALVGGLLEGVDYSIDRRARRIDITALGRIHIEELAAALGAHCTSTPARSELLVKALTATMLFERDVHYLVRDGRICIIDEYIGRVMQDRNQDNGLSRMIEAKENSAPSGRHGLVARITYQRFFTRYRHLCGMSGTLAEVAGELRAAYGVNVTRVSARNRCRRDIRRSIVTVTANAKWREIACRAATLSAAGRPVLIGTRSLAASQQLSQLLLSRGLVHTLLDAAQDAAEAAIIARAGTPGCITIATNMAGRGVDIRLARGVSDRGGLAVILSERHDAARIDRQLADRGARRGDSGSFTQILSLEDALMDPLRTSAVGQFLLAVARSNHRLACGLFAVMQNRVERRHCVVRRELMRFERKRSSVEAALTE